MSDMEDQEDQEFEQQHILNPVESQPGTSGLEHLSEDQVSPSAKNQDKCE